MSRKYNKTGIDWSIPKEDNLRLASYQSYRDMLKRCRSERPDQYPYYKKKGIRPCDRWLESFDNFIEDMGVMPRMGLTIERKDNSLGYSPENCKWRSRFVQSWNREHKGENPGVIWHKRDKKWMAYVRLDYQFICLGYYEELKDAIRARENIDRCIDLLIDREIIL